MSTWIDKFIDYSYPYGEAPKRVYKWVGMMTLAAAMKRHMWVNFGTANIYPNLYLMFIAPPAKIAKTTTLDRGALLLSEIPSIRFGPTTPTWQSMFQEFDKAKSTFTYQGKDIMESPLVCVVGELGNFIKVADGDLLNQMIDWWDGRAGRKTTLHHGEHITVNPLLTIGAATNPSWFRSTFSSSSVEGGFMSRCLLIYSDGKEKKIANPGRAMLGHEKEIESLKKELVDELRYITEEYIGPFTVTEDVYEFEQKWYSDYHDNVIPSLPSIIQIGYCARKQVMVWKVAQILSVSKGEFPLINLDTWKEALDTVSDLESSMFDIMGQVGMHETAVSSDRVKSLLIRRPQSSADLHRQLFQFIPNKAELDLLLVNMCHAGIVVKKGAEYHLLQYDKNGKVID